MLVGREVVSVAFRGEAAGKQRFNMAGHGVRMPLGNCRSRLIRREVAQNWDIQFGASG